MKWIRFLYTMAYAWSLFLACSPVQISRIMIPQKNGTFLTIDLIYDIHMPTPNQPALKHNQEPFLSSQELLQFLPQERAFINMIYDLDQTADHPINLLWECDPQTDQKLNEQLMKHNAAISCDFMQSNKLLVYYGYYFSKYIFKKNISFIPSDTWRINSLLKEILVHNNRHNFDYLYDTGSAFQFITQHFGNNNPADQLLINVKKYHPEAYDAIKQIYEDFKENALKPLYTQCIAPHLKKKKPLSQALKKIKPLDKLNKLIANILYVPGLMDIELLCNIFGSSAPHTIIYAGADHCNHLLDLLHKQFDGQIITNLGIHYDHVFLDENLPMLHHRRTLTIPIPQLKKEIWSFIAESPQESWQRYLSVGTQKAIVTGGILTIIDSLKLKLSWDHEWRTLLSYTKNAYVDIANAIDNTHQSLIHIATLKRNPSLVRILLAEGAFADHKNLVGRTALSYAAVQKDIEIVQLLLQAGANPNQADDEGLSPLHYSVFAKDTEIIRLLKQHDNNRQ